MLGQEDNPARLREEIEKAKLAPAAADSPSASEIEAARAALYDPRSYLAQSVPRRMAIISAGVIMNLIFAFVLAVIAFMVGVRQPVCEIGYVLPGEGAWRANVQPGDRLLQVGDRPVATFEDMMEAITLGDVQKGIPLSVERPGEKKLLHIEVKAAEAAGRPASGPVPPRAPR